jgi:hypothetical protein
LIQAGCSIAARFFPVIAQLLSIGSLMSLRNNYEDVLATDRSRVPELQLHKTAEVRKADELG